MSVPGQPLPGEPLPGREIVSRADRERREPVMLNNPPTKASGIASHVCYMSSQLQNVMNLTGLTDAWRNVWCRRAPELNFDRGDEFNNLVMFATAYDSIRYAQGRPHTNR